MKTENIVRRVYKFTELEDGYFTITAFKRVGGKLKKLEKLGTKILLKNADEAIQVFAMLNDRGIIDIEKLRQHLEFIKRESEQEDTQEIDISNYGESA